MHQPGYIQEGQEAIFGYLLLGVYYRNSPGCTPVLIEKLAVIYFMHDRKQIRKTNN
jgi:hypothetical protein